MHCTIPTIQGIAHFLWEKDRALALTCLHALTTVAIAHEGSRKQQYQVHFDKRESEDTFKGNLYSNTRQFIISKQAGDEALIQNLDLSLWPARSVAKHIFAIAKLNPSDPLLRQVMNRCIAKVPQIWKGMERSRSIPDEGDYVNYGHEIAHDYAEALCRYAIQLEPSDAHSFFQPILPVAMQYPKHTAELVTQLIIAQGDRNDSSTFWCLWQQFADDFVANISVEKINDEFSDARRLLRELMLTLNGSELSDWEPLLNQSGRIQSLFTSLDPTIQGFDSYCYYLAHLGSSTLPEALSDISTKLGESQEQNLLSDTTVYYLENILTRLIYSGDSQIRTKDTLRKATLSILDALVAAGSSPAYKLRDDFLTPSG
jgi:hypothetical protein